MNWPYTVYHVTTRENAAAIEQQGFLGGWGDAGFGVYFYGSLVSAQAYAARGGWDRSIEPGDAAIVVATVPCVELSQVEVNPAWPNPEDYADVLWHPMEEDDEDALWTPERSILTPAMLSTR